LRSHQGVVLLAFVALSVMAVGRQRSGRTLTLTTAVDAR
jgi:hypothetical protein